MPGVEGDVVDGNVDDGVALGCAAYEDVVLFALPLNAVANLSGPVMLGGSERLADPLSPGDGGAINLWRPHVDLLRLRR